MRTVSKINKSMDKENTFQKNNSTSLWSILKKNKTSYFITIALCILIDIILCLSMPKMYASQIKISDEPKETDILIGLSNFAALVNKGVIPSLQEKGINNPEVYPYFLSSQEFAIKISQTNIKKYNYNLFYHIKKTHKATIIEWFYEKIMGTEINDYMRIIKIIQNNIKYSITPFNHTITIQYTDKNPIVAYTIVITIQKQLQKRLADQKYDLNKKRLINATRERKDAGIIYHRLQKSYANLIETNTDPTLPSIITKLNQLREERDHAFELYQKACTKEQRYKFLSIKNTPTFSIIRKPYIPLKPISPKPIPYFFTILSVGFIITTWKILLLEKLKYKRTNQ